MRESVFVSYRRDDSAAEAGALYRALCQQVGEDSVFMDTSSTELGARWPDKIKNALMDATTVIVVIGPSWLRSNDESGRRRIDSEADWVRQEISFALKQPKRLIPVLVRGAKLPSTDALPSDLQEILMRQSIEIRRDYWDHDIKLLLEQVIKEESRDNDSKATRGPYPKNIPNSLSSIEQLNANLDSHDATKRIDSVKTLEQSSDPAARKTLVQATKHHLRDVRIEVAFALARLQDEHAALPLINLLHDEQKRRAAEDAIVQLGELAIHDLVATLGSDNATQQKRVLSLLGRIQNCGDEVMSSLTNALHTPDREVRYAVIDILGQIGGKSGCRVAVDHLVEIVQRTDADKAMRSAAVKALGQAKDRDAISDLIKVLHDPDLEVRNMVINTLGKIGGSGAVLRLGEIAQGIDEDNKDKEIRISAIKALGQPKNTDAVPILKRILLDVCERKFADTNELVSIGKNAAKALREIGLTQDVEDFILKIRPQLLVAVGEEFKDIRPAGDLTPRPISRLARTGRLFHKGRKKHPPEEGE